MENTNKEKKTGRSSLSNVRYITVTGMLSAIAFILMFLDFSVPFMPGFIKMDISELPAIIASFMLGPLSGVLVCLVKNLIHLTMTTTGGVGELCNFMLGALFVLPAGFIYKNKKNKKTAIIGALVGAIVMGIGSVPSNYFITYPFYYNFMPKEAIIAAYNAILSAVSSYQLKSILPCLVIFNMPFTFLKGVLCSIICMLIYKPLSRVIKG